MNYSQFGGSLGHIKGGHGMPYRDSILGPTRVLTHDPCHLGLPEIFTISNVFSLIRCCTSSGLLQLTEPATLSGDPTLRLM